MAVKKSEVEGIRQLLGPGPQPTAGPEYWQLLWETLWELGYGDAEINLIISDMLGQSQMTMPEYQVWASRMAAAKREIQAAVTEAERQRMRDQATVRAMEEREREVMEAAAGEVAGFKTQGQITAEVVERGRGISPAFSRFLPSELDKIFEELGMAQKRQQWQEEFIRGSTGALPPVRPISEGEEAQRLADVEWEKGMPGFQRSRDILRRADPWAQLLQQPTFLEQLENRFRSLTPQERGFRAGRTRPRTRFI